MKITEEDIKRNPIESLQKIVDAYSDRTDRIMEVCHEVHEEKIAPIDGIRKIVDIIHQTTFV